MPNYRRAFVPGGTWFYTVNLLNRQQKLLIDHVDALRSAFEITQQKYPFVVAAIVVLPDHLHAI
jgi:putative transposase